MEHYILKLFSFWHALIMSFKLDFSKIRNHFNIAFETVDQLMKCTNVNIKMNMMLQRLTWLVENWDFIWSQDNCHCIPKRLAAPLRLHLNDEKGKEKKRKVRKVIVYFLVFWVSEKKEKKSKKNYVRIFFPPQIPCCIFNVILCHDKV